MWSINNETTQYVGAFISLSDYNVHLALLMSRHALLKFRHVTF